MKLLKMLHNYIKMVFVLLLMLYFILICKNKSICGYSFALVVGNSMYSTLCDGDFLLVDQKVNYNENDIVCFVDEEGRKIVHRIIKMDEYKITTKGDFNDFCDIPILSSQVIGKVVFKSSLIGFVFRNLHILITAFVIIILLKLKNFEKYDKIYL